MCVNWWCHLSSLCICREEGCCLELYLWRVEVLTTTDWLFVCRVWNKQLLVVTPKPGVKLADVWVVCVHACVRVYVCMQIPMLNRTAGFKCKLTSHTTERLSQKNITQHRKTTSKIVISMHYYSGGDGVLSGKSHPSPPPILPENLSILPVSLYRQPGINQI